MTSSTSNEKCPHCGNLLKLDENLGYRRARIIHLVTHSICAALEVTPQDLPDRSYWEVAENCPEDTWEEAARASHDEILDAIDSVVPLSGEQLDKAETKAITWLKSKYPQAFVNW
jgi:hypothetical protein